MNSASHDNPHDYSPLGTCRVSSKSSIDMNFTWYLNFFFLKSVDLDICLQSAHLFITELFELRCLSRLSFGDFLVSPFLVLSQVGTISISISISKNKHLPRSE